MSFWHLKRPWDVVRSGSPWWLPNKTGSGREYSKERMQPRPTIVVDARDGRGGDRMSSSAYCRSWCIRGIRTSTWRWRSATACVRRRGKRRNRWKEWQGGITESREWSHDPYVPYGCITTGNAFTHRVPRSYPVVSLECPSPPRARLFTLRRTISVRAPHARTACTAFPCAEGHQATRNTQAQAPKPNRSGASVQRGPEFVGYPTEYHQRPTRM